MKIENVSGINFEERSDEELFTKQLRCPTLEPFNFNHEYLKDKLDIFSRENLSVLEIGCGWGRNALFFKDKPNVRYYSFDPSPTSRKYFQALNLPKGRFYVSNEIDETILEKKYDFIYSVYVLQHVGWPSESNTVTTIMNALIPTLKEDGYMMFYELNQGQNKWDLGNFQLVLRECGLKVCDYGRVVLEKNDAHNLIIARRG